ncbi:cytochrome b/b6 domain-containing protein [Variovorax sp. LjRoot84]|uniref:cytochrome b/b6 domain-containing protein n=1 Tax=Variovorax sp. LjRoot84 TaxID=3342340 RepID=UPI003ED08F36
MAVIRPLVPVWDVAQRLLHWGLAAAATAAWLSGEETLAFHIAAGYATLALASTRILLGFVGSRNARFANFVRSPGAVWRYGRSIVQGREHRYLGHNPLGGWMVLALLLLTVVVCASGYMYTTDAFWGLRWVEWIHRGSAWLGVALVCVHVSAVFVMGRRHGDRLVAAMLTGLKRPARPPCDAEASEADCSSN